VARYEIRVRVQGELGPTWSAMFSGLCVEPQADGTTLLRGSVQDQAALHGLLGAIRDLGLSIVAAETVAVSGASAHSKTRER
jgi:hypothetical protein